MSKLLKISLITIILFSTNINQSSAAFGKRLRSWETKTSSIQPKEQEKNTLINPQPELRNLETLESRIEELENKLDQLEQFFETFEENIDSLRNSQQFTDELEDLKTRIEDLESGIEN